MTERLASLLSVWGFTEFVGRKITRLEREFRLWDGHNKVLTISTSCCIESETRSNSSASWFANCCPSFAIFVDFGIIPQDNAGVCDTFASLSSTMIGVIK
ncbi:unnamed protein product, partial [Acanthocheilonema viteae]